MYIMDVEGRPRGIEFEPYTKIQEIETADLKCPLSYRRTRTVHTQCIQ